MGLSTTTRLLSASLSEKLSKMSSEILSGEEPLTGDLPSCVICRSQIEGTRDKVVSVWNEACLLKLYGIQSESLDKFPSLTFYCDNCALRNQKILDYWTQIEWLQQALEEMKASLDMEFKLHFDLEDARNISDRTNFLRHEVAKCIKLLPDEEEASHNLSPAASPCASVDLDPSDGRDSVESISYNGEISSPAATTVAPKKIKRGNLKENQERVKSSKADKSQTEDTKIKIVSKERFKTLSIKIGAIPPDLLKNLPVNVHKVPGYVPSPRTSPRATARRSNNFKSESNNYSNKDAADCAGEVDLIESKAPATKRKYTRRKGVEDSPEDKFIETNDLSTEKEDTMETKVKPEAESKEKGERSTKRMRKRYPPGTVNRFYCELPECKSQGYNTKEQLEVHHKKVHLGITHPFKCEECGREFRLLTQYKFHYRGAHLGQYNFSCDFCGKGFHGRGNMQKHRVMHTNERNYKCSECPMDFKTAHGRVLHMRYAHTGERPFTCEVCGKGFVSSTKLTNHMKCVHHREERPVICHICGKNFPIQGYLYMHMRTHENEAALAAGKEVKRKPRWRKKEKDEKSSTSEDPATKNTENAVTSTENAEERPSTLIEPNNKVQCNTNHSESAAEVLELEIKRESLNVVAKDLDELVLASQNKTLPLDLHLPLYQNQTEYIRAQTSKTAPMTNNKFIGTPQFFLSNFDHTFPSNFQ